MTRFDIITIFPKIFDSYFNESIIWRAQKLGKIKINIVDLRKFSTDRHKKIDDKPYGGGPGMVFKIEPLARAVESIKLKAKSQKLKTKVILFSPAGEQFNSKMAAEWARKYDQIIMIAGRYEGVDERIKKIIGNWKLKIENLSIGPYVLTGGELPVMVVVDAVSRHISGVLGKNESLEEERLGVGVPIYTRPEIFKWKGKKYIVPKVLLSGNHKKIEMWKMHHKRKMKREK
ncbi:MAG: tRNA (guanosine(37)-N1)-methyltransferase TrmD [Parcubacteria group bacterium]|nr:tRNA (guanosine(37)-N1)-methyltransferase TrmD [Parcubacteria group bacterium]